MAKGQKRSNREIKKPKKAKTEAAKPGTSSLPLTQPGGAARKGFPKR